MASDIGLCAKALIALGAQPIQSFEDGTAEAQIAALLYPTERDGLLSAYPWKFATVLRQLSRLAQAAPDGRAQYLPPPALLRLLSVQASDGTLARWEVQTGAIVADIDSAYARYIQPVAESQFPVFFEQLLVWRLAAVFCIPVTDNTSRADALLRQYEARFETARRLDASQVAPPVLASNILTAVR